MMSASSIHLWSSHNLLNEASHTPPGFPGIQHASTPAIPQFKSPGSYPMPPRVIRAPLLSFLVPLVALDDAPPVHAAMHARLNATEAPALSAASWLFIPELCADLERGAHVAGLLLYVDRALGPPRSR
jgi:hypothetical protein